MAMRMVMWPPIAIPKVTAGLTWPPEMLTDMKTATVKAKVFAIAILDDESAPAILSVTDTYRL